MNFSELKDTLHRLLHVRSDVTEAIRARALNQALVRLPVLRIKDMDRTGRVLQVHIPELEDSDTTQTLTELGRTYNAPSDAYYTEDVDVYNPSNACYEQLTWMNWQRYRAEYLDDTTGSTPEYWTQRGSEIYLGPLPDATYAGGTLRLWYYRHPATLVSDSASPELPDEWHLALAYLAARDLYREFGEDERSDEMTDTLRLMLSELMGRRRARRWATTRLDTL